MADETMDLEMRWAEKYMDMEECNLGGNLFDLHIRLHHLPLLVVFGSPSQCMEFHCGEDKMEKKKKTLKKETTNV